MCKVLVRYQVLWKGSFGHKVLTVSILFIIIYFNYGLPCVFQKPGMFFLWNSICIDDPSKEKCAWAHAAWNDARCGTADPGGKRIFQEWHQHPPQNGTWDVDWKARKKSCVWKPLSFERPAPTACDFLFLVALRDLGNCFQGPVVHSARFLQIQGVRVSETAFLRGAGLRPGAVPALTCILLGTLPTHLKAGRASQCWQVLFLLTLTPRLCILPRRDAANRRRWPLPRCGQRHSEEAATTSGVRSYPVFP